MVKRALCVGINDYPGSNMDLAGCVNDAKDWQALLEQRGYVAEHLHDAEATRARIVERLKALVSGAADGDSLVFTFSGHGSWLPDDDRDEPDARDEMMCPHDVMQGQYLLDDDLYEIFCTKAPGARLYVIGDCCHSGSVVRYASAPTTPDTAPTKARFLPPYMFARGDRAFERAIDRAVNTPAPTKLDYPALLFSGCQDTEFSYDTSFKGRPNGAFTRTAIDALRDASITTPRALYDAIRLRLPSQALPQTPQLFGSREAKLGPLF
jgi:metacaspase-1